MYCAQPLADLTCFFSPYCEHAGVYLSPFQSIQLQNPWKIVLHSSNIYHIHVHLSSLNSVFPFFIGFSRRMCGRISSKYTGFLGLMHWLYCSFTWYTECMDGGVHNGPCTDISMRHSIHMTLGVNLEAKCSENRYFVKVIRTPGQFYAV